MSVKKLTGCAACIAVAVVTSMLTVYRLPFGGSVNLFTMLFIMLPGWLFGPGLGIISGVVYGLISFIIEPYFITIPQFLFDYILAFGIMGLGGLVREKDNSLLIGYLIAIFGRWVMGTIAGLIWVSLGMTAWDGWAALPYSMAYNGAYIAAEGVITIILIMLPPVKKALYNVKQQVLS